MTGSSMAPIIIPIVALLSLAFWIVMVIYADRHPVHGHGPPSGPPGELGRAPGSTAAPGVPRQARSEMPAESGEPGAGVSRSAGPQVARQAGSAVTRPAESGAPRRA